MKPIYGVPPGIVTRSKGRGSYPAPTPGHEAEPPPPPPPPTSGVFDLVANPNFDPVNPTIKTGDAFNQEMKDIYQGLLDYYIEGSGELGLNNTTNILIQLGNQDSYNVARYAWRLFGPFVIFFRLTGDLRLLDAIARYANLAYNGGMWTANSNNGQFHPNEATGMAYHEKRTWIWTQSASTDFWGNDKHPTDTPGAFNCLVMAAAALQANRNEVSPEHGAGYYASEADKWLAVYEGYRQVWSADPSWDGSWPNGITASDMNGWYDGYWEGGNYDRQPSNQWPMNRRTFTHSNMESASLHYHMGKLLGLESLGQMAIDDLMGKFVDREVYYDEVGGNPTAFYGRAFTSLISGTTYLMPQTYQEYVVVDLVNLWLEGDPGTRVTLEMLEALANGYKEWGLKVGNTSALLGACDVGGGSAKTGTNASGQTITLADACSSAGFCADHSESSVLYYGSGIWAGFNDNLYDWMKAGLLRRDGSLKKPRTTSVLAGLFLKNALF